MNWLQMFINLSAILSFASFISWIVSTFPFEKERTRKPAIIVAITVSIVFLFCAAMAGLLS